MNQKVVLAIIATLLVSMPGIGLAFAVEIDGEVLSGGSSLNDAKATAERVSEYEWDRTNSGGVYIMTVDTTNSYTVSSMKEGYTRDVDAVNGGDTAPDQTLSARTYETANFKVGYDTSTSVTLTEARDWLLDGEPWFRDEHAIDFVATTASEAWTSGAPASCATVVAEMNNDIGWSGGDYDGGDVLFGFTDGGLSSGIACINAIPGSGGDHPYIVADFDNTADMARTVMHEMSHAYGFSHTLTCSNQIPGIMATTSSNTSCSDSIYIKNWVPTDDTTLQGNRNWY